MLILTTIGTAFSLWGVLDIYPLIAHFSAGPLYAGLMLASLAVLPLAVAALILLYRKQKLGLTLILTSLAINFVIGLGLLLCTDQMVAHTLASTASQDIAAFGDKDSFITFTKVLWYVITVIGELFVITAAVLWHFAWQDQIKTRQS